MEKATAQATIDGLQVEAPNGKTILEAAGEVGVFIPTLCYHQRLTPYGACRICQVEITSQGRKGSVLVAACTHPLSPGDVVRTDTEEVVEARRFILRLILARAPQAKAVLALAEKYDVHISPDCDDPLEAYLGAKTRSRQEQAGDSGLTHCMLCGLCTRVCNQLVQRQGISETGRGNSRRIRTPFNEVSPTCIGCGSCAHICPNGAITIERVES